MSQYERRSNPAVTWLLAGLLVVVAASAGMAFYIWYWKDRESGRARAVAYASAVSYSRSWVLQDVNRVASSLWRATYNASAGGQRCVLIDLKRFGQAASSQGGFTGTYPIRC